MKILATVLDPWAVPSDLQSEVENPEVVVSLSLPVVRRDRTSEKKPLYYVFYHTESGIARKVSLGYLITHRGEMNIVLQIMSADRLFEEPLSLDKVEAGFLKTFAGWLKIDTTMLIELLREHAPPTWKF